MLLLRLAITLSPSNKSPLNWDPPTTSPISKSQQQDVVNKLEEQSLVGAEIIRELLPSSTQHDSIPINDTDNMEEKKNFIEDNRYEVIDDDEIMSTMLDKEVRGVDEMCQMNEGKYQQIECFPIDSAVIVDKVEFEENVDLVVGVEEKISGESDSGIERAEGVEEEREKGGGGERAAYLSFISSEE